MKRLFRENKNLIVILAAVAGIFALAASWTIAKPNDSKSLTRSGDARGSSVAASNDGTAWSKAVLSVGNMSCGGCIDTIKKSVATVPGTGEVTVDLASSSAEVLFDAKRIKDPKTIAQAVTDGGYPAKIQEVMAHEQLVQELDMASEKAKTHIATVGRLNVPRKDYEIELGHARARYEQIYGTDTFSTPKGKQLLQRIETQIALRLVEEMVKLQEVDRAGYALPADTLDRALSDFAKEKETTIDGLKRDLSSNGYPFDHFQRRFENRVRLQKYLEDIVLADSIDPDDRQRRYGDWLANARTLAKVVYYDKNIESLVKASSGSGCGGGGSGGCSVSR